MTLMSFMTESRYIRQKVLTFVGGLFVLIGVWLAILYAQTEPHHKFDSVAYLNVVQKLYDTIDRHKTVIDSIASNRDTVGLGAVYSIGQYIRPILDKTFMIKADNSDDIYTFKYSNFRRYYNNPPSTNGQYVLYNVINFSHNTFSSLHRLALERMADSTYKSTADIAESFLRIMPYADKPVEALTKKFIIYQNLKKFYGQWCLVYLLGGLVLFSFGLSTWINRVKTEKREEKRLAALKKFEESDKKEIRPAWVMAQETLKEYFDRNLFQIRLIFVVSVFIMIAGFLLIAVGVMMAYDNPAMSIMQNVAVASGLITELIGATFIVIYNSTIRQAITYTDSLERINSVGMSVTILDSMKDTITDKDALNKAKIDVAKLLLTLDQKPGNTNAQES
jgi:hypothetical protein